MRASAGAITTTYIRAGSYNWSTTSTGPDGTAAGLQITTADNGTTWSYYPPDGVNTAVIDGTSGSSWINLIYLNASTANVSFIGLKLQNCHDFAFSHSDGSTNVTNILVKWCDIGFSHAAGGNGFSDMAGWNGHVNCSFINNYIHDCVSMGFACNAFQSGLQAQGLLISGNVCLRCVQGISDGGAIYNQIFNNYVPPSNNPNIIENNFIRDYGNLSVESGGQDHAIYLDQGCNGFIVRGNVMGPPDAAKSAIGTAMITNGYNNQFTGNIIDLGATGEVVAGFWFQSAPSQVNNVFSGNIVIGNYSGATASGPSTSVSGDFTYVVSHDSTASHYSIANNLYFNYGGGQANGVGNVASDSSPITGTNPLFNTANDLYQLQSGSPAFNSPLDFPPIVGGWGPPGFVIPAGTAPSY